MTATKSHKKDADLVLNLSLQSCKLHKNSLSLLNGSDNIETLPVHQRILYARLTAGLSAVELSRILGITTSKMSRLELGQAKRIDVDLLKKIAIACGQDENFFKIAE